MSKKHEITIEVSEEDYNTIKEFEELTGTPSERFIKEALKGGLERAREFLEEVENE